MRLSIVCAMMFAAGVLGQSSTIESNVLVTTVNPTPEPTPEPSPIIETDTQTTITSAPTTTETTTPPIASTAAPPIGGGPTCVQRCLAQSAASVGCRGGADIACVCSSQTYLSLARTCFTTSACNDDDSQMAVQEYGTACSASTTPAITSISTQSSSRTRTNTGSLTVVTTQTIAFTSGAVVSISRGLSSTVTSGFTTVRTGQAGDFGTDGGSSPTSGVEAGANNGAVGMNGRHLVSAGMMMGLGVVGGIAVLVF